MSKTENTTTSSVPGLQDGQNNRKYYFAYGSNCHVSSMLSRCPAAICIGKSLLNHHKFVLRSVADIESSYGQSVHGALWQITPACENALDRYEGFPHHYTKRQVSVIHDELGELDAMLYTLVGMTYSQSSLRAAYRDVIAQGYVDLGILLRQLNLAVLEARSRFNEDVERIRRDELWNQYGGGND